MRCEVNCDFNWTLVVSFSFLPVDLAELRIHANNFERGSTQCRVDIAYKTFS